MPGCVFDLDGALIDSAAANAALATEGAAGLSLAEVRGFIGSVARVFPERISEARGIAGAVPFARHAALPGLIAAITRSR